MNTSSTTAPPASSPAATPRQAPIATGLSLLVVLALRTGARISTASNPLGMRKDVIQGVWMQHPGQLSSPPVNSFTQAAGHRAAIGSLDQIVAALRSGTGPQICSDDAATL